MDPFTLLLTLGVGLGVQAFGALKSHDANKDYNVSQIQSIQLQQKVEEQRRQTMELDAHRKQIENLRNVQRAKALGLTAATAQGAQFSSGYAGGQAQVEGQGNWNMLGVNQNLLIGRNVFDLNSQISQQKILMAQASQRDKEGQGISSLGSSIMGTGGQLGKIFSGFGTPYIGYQSPDFPREV